MQPFFEIPGTYAGMMVRIVDAQAQQRTSRDVPGPWVRPRCPNKGGRKGSRRQWKRKHAPHYVMLYREPDDVLVIAGRTIIATPIQADALRRATPQTCVIEDYYFDAAMRMPFYGAGSDPLPSQRVALAAGHLARSSQVAEETK